jgi:phosphoglycolate phosphatase
MLKDLTLAFDLDGTLVETAPDLIAATNHVLAGQGLAAVAPLLIRAEISFGARAMIEKGLKVSGAVRSGPEVDRMLADFLAHYEANIAVHSHPFPHVIELLREHRAQGCRLVVCTNKREHLSRVLLGELGMLDLFEGIAGRDTFAVCKPHPEHLLGAIKLAGGDHRHAVMIGDSHTDISTAKAAGVPSIAVTFGYTDVPAEELGAEAVIGDYRQFAAALSGIIRGGTFTRV